MTDKFSNALRSVGAIGDTGLIRESHDEGKGYKENQQSQPLSASSSASLSKSFIEEINRNSMPENILKGTATRNLSAYGTPHVFDPKTPAYISDSNNLRNDSRNNPMILSEASKSSTLMKISVSENIPLSGSTAISSGFKSDGTNMKISTFAPSLESSGTLNLEPGIADISVSGLNLSAPFERSTSASLTLVNSINTANTSAANATITIINATGGVIPLEKMEDGSFLYNFSNLAPSPEVAFFLYDLTKISPFRFPSDKTDSNTHCQRLFDFFLKNFKLRADEIGRMFNSKIENGEALCGFVYNGKYLAGHKSKDLASCQEEVSRKTILQIIRCVDRDLGQRCKNIIRIETSKGLEISAPSLLNYLIRNTRLREIPVGADGKPIGPPQTPELRGRYETLIRKTEDGREILLIKCRLTIGNCVLSTGSGDTKRRAREESSKRAINLFNSCIDLIDPKKISGLVENYGET